MNIDQYLCYEAVQSQCLSTIKCIQQLKVVLAFCPVDPGKDMIIHPPSIKPGQCPYRMPICPGVSPQIALIAAKSKAKRLRSHAHRHHRVNRQGSPETEAKPFLSRPKSSVHHITYTRYRELMWLIYFPRKTPRTHYIPQEPVYQGIIASRTTGWTLFLAGGKSSGTCIRRLTLAGRPG